MVVTDASPIVVVSIKVVQRGFEVEVAETPVVSRSNEKEDVALGLSLKVSYRYPCMMSFRYVPSLEGVFVALW